MTFWEAIGEYWHITTAAFAAIDGFLLLIFIPWILALKKEATSAVAWCLLVILLPFIGMVVFLLFGYQSVHRPLKKKVLHRQRYRERSSAAPAVEAGTDDDLLDPGYEGLARLAVGLNASHPTDGNRVSFYNEGHTAFRDVFAEIEDAKHHVHVQFFIFRYDHLGKRLLELLARKARQGIEIRLLTDGIGTRCLGGRRCGVVFEAGGKVASFLPVNLWRRRVQVNLRNHRKLVVVDGETAFTGGLNVGDEYLGEVPEFGYWRDTFLKIQGPAVESLQRVFVEDWDFAAGETLHGERYFPEPTRGGDVNAQVIASGPDQELKSIREIYFAAIMKARKRLWITTPYYVPDQAIRDGLCLAGRSGVDVRLLMPKVPDHLMTYFAGQYYLPDLFAAGVKVYQYTKGFIHAKVMLVDGQWASVGTANLDNRSLLLNFEVNCLFHTARVVKELEDQFVHDLDDSIQLDGRSFAKRKLVMRLAENFCRLFGPVL